MHTLQAVARLTIAALVIGLLALLAVIAHKSNAVVTQTFVAPGAITRVSANTTEATL